MILNDTAIVCLYNTLLDKPSAKFIKKRSVYMSVVKVERLTKDYGGNKNLQNFHKAQAHVFHLQEYMGLFIFCHYK